MNDLEQTRHTVETRLTKSLGAPHVRHVFTGNNANSPFGFTERVYKLWQDTLVADGSTHVFDVTSFDANKEGLAIMGSWQSHGAVLARLPTPQEAQGRNPEEVLFERAIRDANPHLFVTFPGAQYEAVCTMDLPDRSPHSSSSRAQRRKTREYREENSRLTSAINHQAHCLVGDMGDDCPRCERSYGECLEDARMNVISKCAYSDLRFALDRHDIFLFPEIAEDDDDDDDCDYEEYDGDYSDLDGARVSFVPDGKFPSSLVEAPEGEGDVYVDLPDDAETATGFVKDTIEREDLELLPENSKVDGLVNRVLVRASALLEPDSIKLCPLCQREYGHCRASSIGTHIDDCDFGPLRDAMYVLNQHLATNSKPISSSDEALKVEEIMAMHEWNMTQQKAMAEHYTDLFEHSGYTRRVYTQVKGEPSWYREYRLWRDPKFASSSHALFTVMSIDFDTDNKVRRNSWQNRGNILAELPTFLGKLDPQELPGNQSLGVLLKRAIQALDPDIFDEGHRGVIDHSVDPDSRKSDSSLEGAPKGEGSSPEILVQQKAGRVARFARHKSTETLVVYNDKDTWRQCKIEEVLEQQLEDEDDEVFLLRVVADKLVEDGTTYHQLREALEKKAQMTEESEAELKDISKDALAEAYAKLKGEQAEEESKRDIAIAQAERVSLRLKNYPCELCHATGKGHQDYMTHEDDCPVGDLHRALDALKEGKVGEGDAENKKGYRVYCKWVMVGSVDLLADSEAQAVEFAEELVEAEAWEEIDSLNSDDFMAVNVYDDTECDIDMERLRREEQPDED